MAFSKASRSSDCCSSCTYCNYFAMFTDLSNLTQQHHYPLMLCALDNLFFLMSHLFLLHNHKATFNI